MQPGYNCKNGSAWHTWQTAGADWRKNNPNAGPLQTRQAAIQFANLDGWPENGKNARYRAFKECAT